jgi:hypothetical protein
MISTLRQKLNLSNDNAALIDSAVLQRIDNLAGLLSADVVPSSSSSAAAAALSSSSSSSDASVERRVYNPITAKAWICELDEDIASNPDTAFDEMKKEWGKDPKEFKVCHAHILVSVGV